MGRDATAALSYGFIIPQSKVLKLLQKLQNGTEKVTSFGYGEGFESLLRKHFKEAGIDEEDFEMEFLTSGEDEFKGLAV
jgi:hypothetical protein